jgi:hypothetical protein
LDFTLYFSAGGSSPALAFKNLWQATWFERLSNTVVHAGGPTDFFVTGHSVSSHRHYGNVFTGYSSAKRWLMKEPVKLSLFQQ